MPETVPWILFALGVLLALVAGWIALRYRRIADANAERIAVLDRTVRARDEELTHLVERRLPALVHGAVRGVDTEVPGPLHHELHGAVLDLVRGTIDDIVAAARENADQAAREVVLAVARKLQGLANNQQLKLTEMVGRHDDPAFLEDLMRIDHTNAQILRRAVGMAVFCRAWPGRQHSATELHDVVRGAMSRILDYQRVHVVRIEDTRRVLGRVVEPLVMTLAELLENATRSSHPSTPVQVHVQLTHTGVAFVVEDAGVGLGGTEREKVVRLLGDASLGMSDLGNPPCFGLATCGALARRYGFTVWVDSGSAFGGARAVVHVPGPLLTEPGAGRPLVAVAEAPPRPQPTTTANGLPKRVRQHAPAIARPPGQAAAPLSAFQRASRKATEGAGAPTEGSQTP
ncbi:ATP-binding protein [Allokutzneria sp. A3M-2-11 16]|uniref:ATP-binding protein n=1 Tax=Allokutzneria sp. A3M-2-11 16 TaxID=2962043 RepID=UPI0020B8D17B|nr:ATP-binding protein [Allokutzneria sp. A3M-2-11 16]MCP3805006.1 ATP-binding protein [Allokutzneria sp. A3M-2-11 16]